MALATDDENNLESLPETKQRSLALRAFSCARLGSTYQRH